MPVTLGRQPEIVQSNWLSPSLANGAFMHSLLCVSALHFYMTHSGSSPGDANMAAVFNLLCVEETMFLPTFKQEGELARDSAHRDVHLRGLLRMVELRGGVRNLENRCLQAFIVR